MLYVEVADLRAAIERALALGAGLQTAPTSIPDGSWFAVVRDPQGLPLGLWSAIAGPKASADE